MTKEKFGRQLPLKALYIADAKKGTKTSWLNVAVNHSNHTFILLISTIVFTSFPCDSKNKTLISLIETDTKPEVTEKDKVLDFISNNPGTSPGKISEEFVLDFDATCILIDGLKADGLILENPANQLRCLQ